MKNWRTEKNLYHFVEISKKSKDKQETEVNKAPEVTRAERKAMYKKAPSQGAYIDRLRVKYPFRICRTTEPQYEAVLTGVQPLLEGQECPIYRFPGGTCCEDPFAPGITILEW